MHSFNYINCFLVSVKFLEELAIGMPYICQMRNELEQKITIYRKHLSRDYLVPCQIMNELRLSDIWFESFKESALRDYSMILNTILITMEKEADRRLAVITRNFTLRFLDVRLQRTAIMKQDLFRQFCPYINNIYIEDVQIMSNMATDAAIDEYYSFI